MSQVSRPMQIALAATLLLFAVWFVALRPKPQTEGEAPAPAPAEQPASSGAAPGTDGLSRAVDKAQRAVTTANDAGERAAGSGAEAPAASGGATAARASGKPAGSGDGGVSTAPIHTNGPVASVRAALRMHKAIAIAFVDSATADSRAVDRELLHVSKFGGRAFTLSVPLADIADYAFITNSVEVTVAPTVVIVDPQRRATTIVGAADRVEIEQRLADALKAPAKH
ncbi:MAG TPA: hypothetical protein VFS37_03650 [Conexibacter sp.]|nr:hypothetical protein [Conexibacter sp.]